VVLESKLRGGTDLGGNNDLRFGVQWLKFAIVRTAGRERRRLGKTKEGRGQIEFLPTKTRTNMRLLRPPEGPRRNIRDTRFAPPPRAQGNPLTPRIGPAAHTRVLSHKRTQIRGFAPFPAEWPGTCYYSQAKVAKHAGSQAGGYTDAANQI